MTLPLLALLAVAPIDQVVVYPDRAQVHRATEVSCTSGAANAAATFSGITPAADQGSFRARAHGVPVLGLSVQAKTRTELFSPALEKLDAQVQRLEDELTRLEDERARLMGATERAGRYGELAAQLISREMTEPKPDPKAWRRALDVALENRLTAAATLVELAAKVRDAQRRLEDTRRKQKLLAAAAQRREYEVVAVVGCPRDRARIELTYMVGGASWESGHEARANEGARVVEVSTYATVRQSTGEDWNNARVILSTAIPSENATPPELTPLRVWAEERKEEKKVLVSRSEQVQHAEAGAADEAAAGEGALTARNQGLSVQLEVPERSDVPGDATPVRLLVGKHRMKARFAHRTVPKLMPWVFRVADLTNSAPYPLLAGQVDVFRASGLIARYSLERVPQGGTFHLTFGVDDALKVQRTVITEVKRDAGLFGGKRRFHYAYRFELASFASTPVEVELSEHIPVSELDDVVVQVDPKTTRGYELAASDGILTWKVKLAPKAKQTVDLAYQIDVPSSYDSGGL